MRPCAGAGRRVVVSDDGARIRLSIYAGGERRAAVAIDPLPALRLGRDLIDAAARHIERAGDPTPRRRGGDAAAERRRRRDAALRRLAALLFDDDVPMERRARDLVDRLRRYRPVRHEASAERRLMREVIASGLPVPGVERLRKILVKQFRGLDNQNAVVDHS